MLSDPGSALPRSQYLPEAKKKLLEDSNTHEHSDH